MPSNPGTKAANPQAIAQNTGRPWVQWCLIGVAIAYLALILLLPAVNIFVQAFKHGVQPFLSNFGSRSFLHAIKLTLLISLITVPVNTVFGLCTAWAIARHQFPGRAFLLSVLDIPFAISPVIVGLMMVLLYGNQGWFNPFLEVLDLKITFALPGMVLATAFVTMPFIAREVIPVLEETGQDQEEAAKILGAGNWQIFWRVTLPNIRWGLLYGVILCNARAMGEFGAVSVVSGNIIGRTQTLPLFVEASYKQYETTAAYSAAVLLGCLAILTLVFKEILERKTHSRQRHTDGGDDTNP